MASCSTFRKHTNLHWVAVPSLIPPSSTMLSSLSYHTAPTAQNSTQLSGEFSWPDFAKNYQPASSEVCHFNPEGLIFVLIVYRRDRDVLHLQDWLESLPVDFHLLKVTCEHFTEDHWHPFHLHLLDGKSSLSPHLLSRRKPSCHPHFSATI